MIVLTWLLKNWKLAGIGAGVLALLLAFGVLIHSRNEWRSTAKDSVAALTLSSERLKTASAQALANANANVVKVKTEQEQITKDVTDEYETKLSASSSAYERLRDQAAAYSRNTSSDSLSAARESACRAYAGTGCEAIPPLLKAAQDNTDALIALQSWETQQEAVKN